MVPLNARYFLTVRKYSVYLWRNIEVHSCNHSCTRKAIIITYSECVFVALSVHHAKHMRHIVACGLPESTIFSPHYLLTCTIFEKKERKKERKKEKRKKETLLVTKRVGWVSLQTFCTFFFISRRIERHIIKNMYRSSCKVVVMLVRF